MRVKYRPVNEVIALEFCVTITKTQGSKEGKNFSPMEKRITAKEKSPLRSGQKEPKYHKLERKKMKQDRKAERNPEHEAQSENIKYR